MSLISKIKRATRGGVTPGIAALEVIRRSRASFTRRVERRSLHSLNQCEPRLLKPLAGDELVDHFRSRRAPTFFAGFNLSETPTFQKQLFPNETRQLESLATQIVDEHRWSLLGFGPQSFGDPIDWRRDPLSDYQWPLDYHAEIKLLRNDGSDVRVLWELNRLGHLVTLARSYALSRNENISREFFVQLESWSLQNPFGRGPNWTCAMEVALRAINLLAAFEMFRYSPQLNHASLSLMLRMFQQHGTYIANNLEFSYLATSNHYLSDVVGLLWLGVMLPELADAASWAELGLREMLREMDKQVLPDGADFESSTGYHRFVLELLLYSFLLCRENSISISEEHWEKLHAMLRFMRYYLRPDGMAPVIGDSDSGQLLPITKHRANDHAFLLTVGAVSLCDADLKLTPANEEVLWLLGGDGIGNLEKLKDATPTGSAAFRDAGLYFLRQDDMYLCFNASGPGLHGRGSHGHNDALSVEVSVGGHPFIVDPGTYVYTADTSRRQQFRSTAFHSTVMIDGVEQNTIDIATPFVIGNEAHPRVLKWESGPTFDGVVAQHEGYTRLSQPVVHQRSVSFDKAQRVWSMEDRFIGEGEHTIEVRFHFAAGLEITAEQQTVMARHRDSDARLVIVCSSLPASTILEDQFNSLDYGAKESSQSACLRFSCKTGKLGWLLVPICKGENLEQRMEIATSVGTEPKQ
jgi:heparinase II/III-like protein